MLSFSDRISRPKGGMFNLQGWNDEELLVFDCISRLSTYKYIGVYDKDEYIVPELKTPIQGSLKSFLVCNENTIPMINRVSPQKILYL